MVGRFDRGGFEIADAAAVFAQAVSNCLSSAKPPGAAVLQAIAGPVGFGNVFSKPTQTTLTSSAHSA